MLPNWINVELTSRCNKACHFCGRAKDRKEGLMKTGDMPFDLFELILEQYTGSVLQFNKDGEPLLYPALREVGERCRHLTTNIVTNGILLMDRKDDLRDNFTSVTVSVYEDDAEQFETVKRFVESAPHPKVYIKFLGQYENPEYAALGLKTLRRTIHNPRGDTNYEGSKPPIPELGVCLDFLFKPSIDHEGNVFICNRYDPECKGMLGNIKNDTFEWMWNSPLRQHWLHSHKIGRRDLIPLCKDCEFWGSATNG